MYSNLCTLPQALHQDLHYMHNMHNAQCAPIYVENQLGAISQKVCHIILNCAA